MARQVFLSLGSNLGDRDANLRGALAILGSGIHITTISSLYETAPVGVADQPSFLNLAAGGDTALAPEELLAFIKQTEHDVGRRPTFHWGPRVVDIDILLYGDYQLETASLRIPHAEMLNRAFVLVPLADIAPEVVHPIAQLPIHVLRDGLTSSEEVHRLGPFTPVAGE